MKKAEETVTVEVTPDEIIPQVRDIDLQLSTGEDTEATLITDHINGTLDSLIISSSKKTEILVQFAEIPIIVYTNKECEGLKYIPLRNDTISPDNQRLLGGGFAPFKLNNALKISIFGSQNTNVEITLRLC